MKECDYNHLLLYAKGWYQRGNVIEDIRKILGHRCNIDSQHISNRDVWEQLVGAFLEYCDDEFEVRSLLLDIFKPWAGEMGCEPFTFWTDTSSFERMVHQILGYLGTVQVVVVDAEKTLYLGEPDPRILSLSDNIKGNKGKS